MRTDVFFFGAVPMPDAGKAGPVPTERRYDNDAVIAGFDNLVHWTKTCDRIGYDTAWYTEHHFQHEGYEVVPNLVMLGLAMAAHTERVRFGQMFNVVPQWHPLRLAEDFAMADILTGGRMVFGVGRGTVPREAENLGAMVASGDNAMSREADRVNREVFEESMEIIKLAWESERFCYVGKHFAFPPTDIPDRGATVSELTLVPRPRGPVEIFQAISSPDTLEYAPAAGHKGVFWQSPPSTVAKKWERYGEIASATKGYELRPGEDRALVLNVYAAPTREQAFAEVRDGHDEFVRFLAPYGRFTGYLEPDGVTKKPFGFAPELEDSVDQKVMAIGSYEDVAEMIGSYQELLGLEHLVLFPEFPGLTRAQIDEQLDVMASEVLPRVGAALHPLAA